MENNNQQNKGSRVLKGKVASDKMQKTIVVEVLRMKKQPKYKKYYKVIKRYKAHDPEDQYRVGDQVFIKESKPISKNKRWVVVGKVS